MTPALQRRAFAALVAGIALGLSALQVRGHRLDELLQAALIAIEPDAVTIQLHLTPGVEICERVIREVDRNLNGAISEDEAKAYAERVRGDLELELDQHPLKLQILERFYPPIETLRTGQGTIHFELKAQTARLKMGPHELEFRNRHLTNVSVYLANVVLSNAREIQVGRQTRNTNQSDLRVAFRVAK